MNILKSSKKIGLPPGSIVFTGEQKVDKVFVRYLEYNKEAMQEQIFEEEAFQNVHQPKEEVVQWYDIRGLHDTELIAAVGETFHVHPLALEDIADTSQRPKLDEYESGIFVSLKAFQFDSKAEEVVFEQVAFYLGNGFLISFQERADDLFKIIRERIEKGKGHVRKKGADYLLYVLLDSIVDRYYVGLESVEERIEHLEMQIVKSVESDYRTKIYSLKQEMLKIRKSVVPLREMMNGFKELEGELVEEKTMLFIRDLRDHIVQTIDLIETYRDNLNSLQDLYLSELSYRMNNVMQVLAVVSAIFIPLTFIAGVYGMNFDHIPELHWQNGYFIIISIMFAIAILLLWYFKKKKWL
ncbi:MAG: magnesium/cobalt transporter CorA [Bacteroidota bacterium]